MYKIIAILLCCAALICTAQDRPDSATVKKLQQTFPEWNLSSFGRCAVMQNQRLWAWKLIFDRPINPRIKSGGGKYGKGYLIFVLVPDIGIDPGKNFISLFDWEMPQTDLKQYTMFLGRGQGYYWYAEGDIGLLNHARVQLKLKDGDNMDQKMEEALNEMDFGFYTSQVAVEYFRGMGSKAVPCIMRALKKWLKTEKRPPVQHFYALKESGAKEASDILIRYASGNNVTLAHLAVQQLVRPPYTASDNFYLRVLPIPEYTLDVLKIFRFRKKTQLLLPKLKKMVKYPRTFGQYAVAVGAVREFESKKFKHIPEYDAINDIVMLSMRMGDDGQTMKYVSLAENGKNNNPKMDADERKRITPALEILRKSNDHELILAGALVLASYTPSPELHYALSYVKRIRRTGMEILNMLPRPMVILQLDRMQKSLERPAERVLLKNIRAEYGG